MSMTRPHVEPLHSWEAPLSDAPAPFCGSRWRVLSADDESGAATALARLPARWSADIGARDRRIELLLLRGELRLDDAILPAGAYLDVPAWVRSATLTSPMSAEALIMIEERVGREQGGGEVRAIDTHECRLEPPGPGVPAGLAIKRLRTDPDSGEMTWLAAGTPEYLEHRAEIHPTVEEAFLLRGDVLLGERGEMRPGDYFWRPANVRHGPIYCRSGRLIFFRTKGGGLSTTYEEVAGWEKVVAAYRAREPFYQGP